MASFGPGLKPYFGCVILGGRLRTLALPIVVARGGPVSQSTP